MSDYILTSPRAPAACFEASRGNVDRRGGLENIFWKDHGGTLADGISTAHDGRGGDIDVDKCLENPTKYQQKTTKLESLVPLFGGSWNPPRLRMIAHVQGAEDLAKSPKNTSPLPAVPA